MTQHGNKLRLALAVYESGEGLASTLDALISTGIGIDRMGLVTSLSCLGGLRLGRGGQPNPASPAARLVDGLEVLGDTGSPAGLRASASLLDLWRRGIAVPALWLANGRAPCLNADLADAVARGAAVLTVVPATPGELWTATRVLLERSASPVLTIEVSLPADGMHDHDAGDEQ